MDFEKVKYRYEQGFWSIPMVRMAVKKGVINKEEFKLITGQDY